jgi:predicted YcjX-like family ATPase
MTVLERLGGFARGSLAAVGAALSEVPTALSHERYRIAITGLQRSGKTVFVTSFAHALLNAASAPKNVFPFFPWRGRVQGVTVEDIPGVPRFPYREHLDDLLSASPKWPARTTSLAGLRVRIRHNTTGFIARRVSSTALLDLDLIDYPGEWLLDLPMLSQSYENWSAQTEELAKAVSRAPLSGAWLEAASRIDLDAAENADALAQVGRLYVEYLHRCRRDANLSFLQPGRFVEQHVNDDFIVENPFFPVSRLTRAKAGSNAAALVRRYRAYQKSVRRFYSEVFGRLRRQIVLVDLLTALQHGHDSFADLALAIRTITDAFEDLAHPLTKKVPFRRVDRLALIATKADHVSADQMLNLTGLLRDMIGQPFILNNAREAGLLSVASVRATSERLVKWQGETRPVLFGIREGSAEPTEIHPGVIPGQIPDSEAWGAYEFNIRNFQPPRLHSPHDQPLPHINLDKVLQFLLA